MKLIIDIPKKDWEFIKEADGCRWSRAILDRVINGTPLEEELEKIRKEMEIIHNRYKINFQGYSMSVAKECVDIIDKEIAELKGEAE